jgi:hypothetical protein
MLTLGDRKIPLPLISQYLGRSRDGVAAGAVAPIARDLILNSIDLVLDDYASAVDAGQSASSRFTAATDCASTGRSVLGNPIGTV